MATANITRDEAAARSEVVSALGYRVTVDVTGTSTDPERTFASETELDFNSTGGSTHLDLIAEEVVSATLDGEPLDISGFDGYRLPLSDLTPGHHTVVVDAVCRYSRTGEGLHRFVDVDGSVYLYTQFETADARRMYATFEQPDQKASFQLTVLAPAEWVVFTNAPGMEPEVLEAGVGRWEHPATPPVPTYITALVAGPYHVVDTEITTAGRQIPARIACRQSMAEFLDVERIHTTTQRGFEIFEEAFGVDYAFDSYDQIFVPEFNAGAMENAGCVTFRDDLVFRSRVTEREYAKRDNTILHELAHMWFGDLVTMQWWDDLWLNESFAEWAASFASNEIARRHETGANPWASFANERKSWAYLQDQLSTTHPIAADMSDLEKVEQNFDGITYAKGASVLKLLVSFVGRDAFLKGVGEYFRKHAWDNTTLQDLLTELEEASQRDLSWFSGEWLETAGVNTLRADFDVDDEGRFTRFHVLQSATEEHPTLRTHRLGIGIYSLSDGILARTEYVELDISGEQTEVEKLIGKQRGDVVLLNDGDLTYAKVRLDEQSLAVLREHMGELHEPLARAVVWATLWDSVRDAELSPQDYISTALAGLASETDMAAVGAITAQMGVCATRFTAPELREEINLALVTGLARLLKSADPGSDKQLVMAQALIGSARSEAATELVRGWLDEEEVPEGLVIDQELRWLITAALAREGRFGEDEIAAELERDDTSKGLERAAGARASQPTEEAKAQAWHLATEDPDVPNETHRYITMGFQRFGQDEVLRPFVDKYLEVAGKISRREDGWDARGYASIASVLRWLFPEPLADADLVDKYEEWLNTSDPSTQVRRTVTERLDEARRALAVQEASRAAGEDADG